MVNILIFVIEVYLIEDEWGIEGSMGSVWEIIVMGIVIIIGSICLFWVFFFLFKMSYFIIFFSGYFYF